MANAKAHPTKDKKGKDTGIFLITERARKVGQSLLRRKKKPNAA